MCIYKGDMDDIYLLILFGFYLGLMSVKEKRERQLKTILRIMHHRNGKINNMSTRNLEKLVNESLLIVTRVFFNSKTITLISQ